MSLLTRDRPPHAPPAPAVGERAPLRSSALLGALAAVQAVLAGLVFAVVPTLLVWMTSPRVEAVWSQVVRVGADVWLLAHGGAISVPAGMVSLLPLGFTLVPLALTWVAGRRLVEALRAVAEPVRRGDVVRALGTFVGVYAALVGGIALVAASEAARPLAGRAALGGAVVALLGTAVAARGCWRREGGREERVLRLTAAAGWALTGWLLLSTGLLVLVTLLGWDRVTAVHSALAPGPGGHVGLVLLQLALAPVMVVWAGAWLAGPGFAVGVGTSVDPGGTVLGPLPALPALGVLPEPGTVLPGAGVVVVLVVALGALAGVRAVRGRGDDRWPAVVLDLVGTAALTGAGAGLLAQAASGAVGPGRMAVVGPVGWQVGVAVAVEVLVGALAAGLLLHALGARPRPADGWLGKGGAAAARLAGFSRTAAGRACGASRSAAGRVAGRARTRTRDRLRGPSR